MNQCEQCHCTEEKKPNGSVGPVELRPYGVGGKWICYSCGKGDTATTKRNMGKALKGDKLLTNRGPIPLIGARRVK